MEPIELGKFIVQTVQLLWERCIVCTECVKGQAIIKRRLGYPIKWRTKPQLYWKFPFIDIFDKVDIRKKYVQFNAHSFHTKKTANDLIPNNIIIDFQVEYQIINPLITYNEYGYNEKEDIQLSFINNMIQDKISKLIIDKGDNLSYEEVYNWFDKTSSEYFREQLPYNKIKLYDDSYRKRKRKDIETKECISIRSIIVTSFDKNISLRTTI